MRNVDPVGERVLGEVPREHARGPRALDRIAAPRERVLARDLAHVRVRGDEPDEP